MSYFSKKLWLVISITLMGIIACKTNKKASTQNQPDQPVLENPKPIMEGQTDSLKKSLDQQRKDRHLKKRKGGH